MTLSTPPGHVLFAAVALLAKLPTDVDDMLATLSALDAHPAFVHIDYNKCANSNKYSRCNADATPGHIYCTNCRIATGGYLRYNPPVRLLA